jgi:hypothetical protein
LVKRHHPDTGHASDPEMIRKVNASYRLLLDYIAVYQHSLVLFSAPAGALSGCERFTSPR